MTPRYPEITLSLKVLNLIDQFRRHIYNFQGLEIHFVGNTFILFVVKGGMKNSKVEIGLSCDLLDNNPNAHKLVEARLHTLFNMCKHHPDIVVSDPQNPYIKEVEG